jgi:hypothetical protein
MAKVPASKPGMPKNALQPQAAKPAPKLPRQVKPPSVGKRAFTAAKGR